MVNELVLRINCSEKFKFVSRFKQSLLIFYLSLSQIMDYQNPPMGT